MGSCKESQNVDDIYIATDDNRIEKEAQRFGAKVIMTDETCENGTARCAQAMIATKLPHDLFVNLQGDAPLTPHWFIEKLIAAMENDPSLSVATPVIKCDQENYSNLLKDKLNNRTGATTCVFD